MKGLSIIIAAFILVFGAFASRGANLDGISAQTGIPVATLQGERASTGLGWGELENAHRSSQATMHAQNLSKVHGKSTATHGKSATAHGKSATTVHGKSATNIGRGHTSRMTTTRGVGHGSSLKFSHMGSHGVGHGMGGMGHGRGR